jgi:GNAT superfamily N-acetyltransferase
MQTQTDGSAGSTAATQVLVTKVATAADKKEFINFQYEVYRNESKFVPPLLMDRENFLNSKKNPWFEFGKVELFLARRGGKVVGRIAAVDDPRYNEFHGVKVGWFGLFECFDDLDAAKALLTEAEAWVKARGMTEILGPANFSSNNEWAFLVDGFDKEPVLMMPYNPQYYLRLIEEAGYKKAKDLWAWEVDLTKPVPEKIARVAEKMRKKEGINVRQANMKDWDNEVRRIKTIYNDAWEKNWGFVPMTDKEFDHLAKDLKMILIPELTLIAEVKGEPVAFAITLPDANQAIKKANGRLFPFGLVKMLLAMKKIRFGRLAILGIRQGYRKRGLDAILMCDTFVNAGKKLGWYGGEIGWTLEDNDMVNRAIELFGAKKYKTYRIYSKPLEASSLKN